ncbi:MAG: hypothetical protein IPO85_21215 [Saprospiraceae bacterium]|uniref:RelA/SpoT domain-containing protein n=1 Tax=Candidatus Defluviibacterium haderslevense TaxID=2981993 RepID=A0A9D7SE82_9BACT|nr:hypothetical protein [Saprospiraceae bacterium]MBK9719977.1 hypothetical protein [Candidatus Defluviibacterium haderslevense]
MINDSQIPIIQKEYFDEQTNLHELLDSIIKELNQLIDYNRYNIEIDIHGRVKSQDSLSRKYEELLFEINTIKQIDDLIGIRIVCLLLSDVEKLLKTIKNYYTDFKKHYNPAEKGLKDRFNYNSNHIIIEKNRFRIEIQIRTLSQHTWAQVSRKFNYKNEIDVPDEIKRPLFRASAHLESADLDLGKFVEDREKHLIHLSEQNINEILDSSLNFDTLRKTLAIKIPAKYKSDSDDLLYFSLLRELRQRGINTVRELVSLIDSELNDAEMMSQKISSEILIRIKKGENTGFDEDKIRNGVRFSYIGLMREMYDSYFKKKADSS